jgi:hypothetical protein
MAKGAPKRQREPQADVAGDRIAAMSALGVFGFATTTARPQPDQSDEIAFIGSSRPFAPP